MFGNELFQVSWAAWLQCVNVDSQGDQQPLSMKQPPELCMPGSFCHPWDFGGLTRDKPVRNELILPQDLCLHN